MPTIKGGYPNLQALITSGEVTNFGLLTGGDSIFDDIPWKESSGERWHEWDMRIKLGKTARHGVSLREIGDLATVPAQIFYGNAIERPDEFMGLAQFFNTLDRSQAQCAVNVSDGGGGDHSNTSVWLIGWSLDSIFMVREPGGLTRGALVPVDWRFVFRIANVDVSKAELDLCVALDDAALRLPNAINGGGREEFRFAYYMSAGAWKMYQTQAGAQVTKHRTIPIRMLPDLRDDEHRVT